MIFQSFAIAALIMACASATMGSSSGMRPGIGSRTPPSSGRTSGAGSPLNRVEVAVGFAHLINDAVGVVLNGAGSFDLALVDVLVHGQIQLRHDGIGAADAAVRADDAAGDELLHPGR